MSTQSSHSTLVQWLVLPLLLAALLLSTVPMTPVFAAATAIPTTVVATLSAEEAAALAYMREEEKLAHDVYSALYATWGLPVFANIAAAERTHSTAVEQLLDRYGLADPAEGAAEGVFANVDLQKLYDQLVAEGTQSLEAALRVGATIEELDIIDLQTRSAETSKSDILRVYGNLERGSGNHLRAFTSTLQRQTGETYEPQYLSQDAYAAITGSVTEQGRGARRNRVR